MKETLCDGNTVAVFIRYRYRYYRYMHGLLLEHQTLFLAAAEAKPILSTPVLDIRAFMYDLLTHNRLSLSL
jgi:hypothetical protein